MTFEKSISLIKLNQMFQSLPLATLCKYIAISGAILFFFHTFAFNHPHTRNQNLFSPFELKFSSLSSSSSSETTGIPNTNVSHIMFVIVGSIRTWKHRKGYIEAWWRTNVTTGNVFLEQAPTGDLLPWSKTSPPFRLNEDYVFTKLNANTKLTSQTEIRMYQSMSDSFKVGSKDVRWYVIADDDTLLFVDNLVEVLNKYDHRKYHYIGMNSESLWSNGAFSFDMGFGGAGYALSYPVVEALVGKMEDCIERYPSVSSDHLSFLCLSDLGVDLTQEKGIHQIDLHGDISGLLSAHPQTPLISLHHFDIIDPIFPSMNRQDSVNHLMETAKTDQTRLLQQTICYHRQNKWSVSVSWGYSVHVYENIYPRNYLKRPLETFQPWKNVKFPLYSFNTRRATSPDPREMPHVFFFDSVKENNQGKNHMVTTSYTVKTARRLPLCSSTRNHCANSITQIRVFAPTLHKEIGRIECCDIEYTNDTDTMDVKLRPCLKDEVLA